MLYLPAREYPLDSSCDACDCTMRLYLFDHVFTASRAIFTMGTQSKQTHSNTGEYQTILLIPSNAADQKKAWYFHKARTEFLMIFSLEGQR